MTDKMQYFHIPTKGPIRWLPAKEYFKYLNRRGQLVGWVTTRQVLFAIRGGANVVMLKHSQLKEIMIKAGVIIPVTVTDLGAK